MSFDASTGRASVERKKKVHVLSSIVQIYTQRAHEIGHRLSSKFG